MRNYVRLHENIFSGLLNSKKFDYKYVLLFLWRNPSDRHEPTLFQKYKTIARTEIMIVYEIIKSLKSAGVFIGQITAIQKLLQSQGDIY